MTVNETLAHLAEIFDAAYIENHDQILLNWIARGLPPDDLDGLIDVGHQMYLEWRTATLADIRAKLLDDDPADWYRQTEA